MFVVRPLGGNGRDEQRFEIIEGKGQHFDFGVDWVRGLCEASHTGTKAKDIVVQRDPERFFCQVFFWRPGVARPNKLHVC